MEYEQVIAPRGLQAIAPAPRPGAPLSNTVSKQSGVYPRLARTDRVASRLRGALTVPIIFVTGIAPKPIPASSPRDARSGLAVEATAAAVRITSQSTPEADCRIGSRLMKRFVTSSPSVRIVYRDRAKHHSSRSAEITVRRY